jgi:hypothetical protein
MSVRVGNAAGRETGRDAAKRHSFEGLGALAVQRGRDDKECDRDLS